MPNTLAHLGINIILSKSLIKKSDLILIYIGAIIPDVPWILQRIVSTLWLGINLYDLRLYSIVLSSLTFSLILSFSISLLFNNSKHVFFVFSIGSFGHLLIDSFETKWGNGVHFFAPLNWDLFNLGFFWNESIVTYLITAIGFISIIFYRKDITSVNATYFESNFKRIIYFCACLFIYFSLPFLLMSLPETVDNHYIKTLRNKENRAGKYFETDRGQLIDNGKTDTFLTPYKEELIVINLNFTSSSSMSIRAKFVSNSEIEILEYHIHTNRDMFTYVGLLLFLVILILRIVYTRKLILKSS